MPRPLPLIDDFLFALSPLVLDESGRKRRLIVVYNELMSYLNQDHKLVSDHKRELFGKVPIVEASDMYWELATVHSLPGGQAEYNGMTRIERMKRRAFLQLDNMRETLDAHYRILERNERDSKT